MASTLTVDNIVGATSSGSIHIPGHVVQIQYNKAAPTGILSSSSSMTDLTGWYVNITPKFANSVLFFQATVTVSNDTALSYERYRIVDGLNGDTQWSTNSYIGMSSYYSGSGVTTEVQNVVLSHVNTAGTTNPMQLQLQFKVDAGGTANFSWSSGDHNTIMVMEIAQ